jgi:hypothetical protein
MGGGAAISRQPLAAGSYAAARPGAVGFAIAQHTITSRPVHTIVSPSPAGMGAGAIDLQVPDAVVGWTSCAVVGPGFGAVGPPLCSALVQLESVARAAKTNMSRRQTTPSMMAGAEPVVRRSAALSLAEAPVPKFPKPR